MKPVFTGEFYLIPEFRNGLLIKHIDDEDPTLWFKVRPTNHNPLQVFELNKKRYFFLVDWQFNYYLLTHRRGKTTPQVLVKLLSRSRPDYPIFSSFTNTLVSLDNSGKLSFTEFNSELKKIKARYSTRIVKGPTGKSGKFVMKVTENGRFILVGLVVFSHGPGNRKNYCEFIHLYERGALKKVSLLRSLVGEEAHKLPGFNYIEFGGEFKRREGAGSVDTSKDLLFCLFCPGENSGDGEVQHVAFEKALDLDEMKQTLQMKVVGVHGQETYKGALLPSRGWNSSSEVLCGKIFFCSLSGIVYYIHYDEIPIH